MSELSIGLGLFVSGSDRHRAWILKNCRALVGPEAGTKSKFSESDKVFAIAHCTHIAVRNWCDCGWVNSFLFWPRSL